MQESGSPSGQPLTDAHFAKRVTIVAAVGGAVALLWLLSPLLLLVFACVLLAITLRTLAWPLRAAGLGDTPSLIATVFLIVAAGGSAAVFYGNALVDQISAVNGSFMAGIEQWLARLRVGDWAGMLDGKDVAASIPQFLSFGLTFGQAVLGAVLVLAGGIYFAADSGTYRNGFLKLIPEQYKDNVTATLTDIANALHRWLGGMLTVMLIVGLLTGVGLWLAGVKSPLALGVLAGVANFVPFIGPIFTALVVLAVAAAQDWHTILLAAGVMLAVQQLEGNIISPIIVGNAVNIPPATGLFAIVAMGLLFGPLGVLLGFPLTIVADIALRRLWIRDTLQEPVEILGEPAEPSKIAAHESA